MKTAILTLLFICSFQAFSQNLSFGLVGGNTNMYNFGSTSFADSINIKWQSQSYKRLNFGVFIGYAFSNKIMVKSILNMSSFNTSFAAETSSIYLGGGVSKVLNIGGNSVSVSLEPEVKIFHFDKIDFSIIGGMRYYHLYNYRPKEQISFIGEADGYIELAELFNNFDEALKPSRFNLGFGVKIQFNKIFLQYLSERTLGESVTNKVEFFGTKQDFYMKMNSQNCNYTGLK